ncbi:hypothetical protein BDV93DRAFT_523998 [Ceratobasidium sp. AG-I]|nr:hypothetical protein BDV93DRAFT_523998 [Ceratobasidium sp. AG-I]
MGSSVSTSDDLLEDLDQVPAQNTHITRLAWPTPDLTLFKTYYTVAMALARGSESGSRPSLPEELVLYICRLAGFCYFNRAYSQESEEKEVGIHSGGDLVSWVWFKTPPLSKAMVNQIASVQLVTLSSHQGWVGDRSQGCWSWFEVGVAPPKRNLEPYPRAKHLPDDSAASYLSHSNRLENIGKFEVCYGDSLDYTHPLWEHVEEGDILIVTLNAQFPGWVNRCQHGILMVNTWWEPSTTMINMMYKPLSS